MSKEAIEEKLGINYTSNEVVEARVNLKINKNASKDDADAFEMLDYLKSKNINLSRHIRLLLALEYRGEIYLNDKYQVVDNIYKSNVSGANDDVPIAATITDVVEESDNNDSMPPSDDDL